MSQSRATFFALLAVLCWSTVATAFKLSLVHLSPLQLIFVASVSALVFFLVLLAWQRRLAELLQQDVPTYWRSFGFALLNPVLYYIVLFHAYSQLPAQEAQSLNYSWAIVLTLMAVPFLGHKLGRFDVLAALVCYLGVLVIATRGDVLGLNFSNVFGVSMALLSTLIWSSYWILNRQDQREPVLGLALNFLFAVPILTLILWVTGDLSGLTTGVALQGWLGGLYVGLVEIGLAFVFWLYAMKLATNTARVANLIFLSPFLSLFFIATFLNETIYSSTLMGLGLIIIGLGIQQKWGVKIEE